MVIDFGLDWEKFAVDGYKYKKRGRWINGKRHDDKIEYMIWKTSKENSYLGRWSHCKSPFSEGADYSSVLCVSCRCTNYFENIGSKTTKCIVCKKVGRLDYKTSKRDKDD